MTDALAPVVDVLFRARDNGVVLRSDDGATGATMFGHFSKFDTWYEIDSWIEGRFLERTVKGSFAKTIRENRSAMQAAYDHGYDYMIGDKPLGPIEELREDDEGAYYEVPLLDTDYNRDFVLPALQGRLMDGRMLGTTLSSSFRFRPIKDEWVRTPKKSTHNPEGLPERTITEARVFEFGPVPYPANPSATAMVRSLTDHFFARSLERSGRMDAARRALGANFSPAADPGTGDDAHDEPQQHSDEHNTNRDHQARLLAEVANLRRRVK